MENNATFTASFNIRQYGAAGDGVTLDTAAIQAAIEACHQAGGGTVWVPAGTFLTGSLFLRSHITLHLEAGATLLGSPNADDFPVIEGRWEGANVKTHASLISGDRLTQVAITGRGSIDGQGAYWWKKLKANQLDYPRPHLIGLSRCTNLLIEGITLTNSPSWTVNPVACENVTIDKISIINPPHSPNTDGINPDSCRNVRISNCYLSVGDDCITLKSGKEDNGREHLSPCENITITNCTMARGHGGVVIGSEMSGDVRRVVISNCVFTGTDRGIRLKSRRGRGGVVEDIRVHNIIMQDVLCPLTMNLYYACGDWGNPLNADKSPQPVSESTPRFRRIHLSNITANGAQFAAAFMFGLAEMPLEDITLSQVSIHMAADAPAGYPEMADNMEKMQQAGLYIRNVRGLNLHQVQVTGQRGPALMLSDAEQVEISGFDASAVDAPVMQLTNVHGVYIHSCQAQPATSAYVHVAGPTSAGIVLQDNLLTHAAQPVTLAADVPPGAVN